MNPIPLSAPDGRLYAYACGICHEVCSSGHLMVQHDGPESDLVAASRLDAERCCACRDCGQQLHRARYGRCPPCAAKEAARQELQRVVYAERDAAYRRRRDESLALARDRDAALQLVAMMRELSEEYYCAGWLHDLEYSLWSIVVAHESPAFGVGKLHQGDMDELRRLSDKAGGWWHWRHGSIDDGELGEFFVPLDEWTRQYDQRRRRVVRSSTLADGSRIGLYEGEVCTAGTCMRPPTHDGEHSQFDGPEPADAVTMHPIDPPEESPA